VVLEAVLERITYANAETRYTDALPVIDLGAPLRALAAVAQPAITGSLAPAITRSRVAEAAARAAATSTGARVQGRHLGVTDAGAVAGTAAAVTGQYGGIDVVVSNAAARITPDRSQAGWRAADLVPDRDAEATSAAVGVMRRLHVPPPPGCTMPEAVAQAEAFDDYVAAFGSAGSATTSVGTRRPRTSSAKSKSFAIDSPILSSSRGKSSGRGAIRW